MNGAEAIVSGTIAAAVPIDVPTKKRVKGITATSKMMNGVERTAFTSRPAVRLKARFGRMPLRSVRCNAIPSGTPSRAPRMPEIPTIIRVSPNELTNRSSISDDMIQLLYDHTLCAQELHGIGDILWGAARQNGQRTESLSLNFIDLAVQNIEIQIEATYRFRQMRLIDTGTGKGETEQMVGGSIAGRSAAREARPQAFQYALGQLMR